MLSAKLFPVTILPALILAFIPVDNDGLKTQVQGRVFDGHGPVGGARIRWQGESCAVTSDDKGNFSIPLSKKKGKRITAWKKGYGIGSGIFHGKSLQLQLGRLPQDDNYEYKWIDPLPDPKRTNNCGNCHGEIFGEWKGSSHAHSAKNKRFISLFAGLDWKGNPSPTWNLLKERPIGSGVCVNCHAPTYHDPQLDGDVRQARGVDLQGVHCDYCHKIADAPAKRLGITFGRDGYELLRPKDDTQLFFGPLDDAHRKGEIFGFSPLYKDSRYCAACHEGIVFGVHVYSTYTEWLASPAKKKGLHCQDCHMAPTGKMTNIAPGKGGIERDPMTLGSHSFPGATKKMLQRCLRVDVTTKRIDDLRQVDVVVSARNVGHRVPTGFVDRNLVLVVEAFDKDKKRVELEKGSRLPALVGQKLFGQAGYVYAKQLVDEKGKSPIPFWLFPSKTNDTRLFPGKSDRRTFWFGQSTRRVQVRLIHRRFWSEVVELKGWPKDDVVVVNRSISTAD
ncbi:MAG: multiheme c-type cytochrome [Gemmataceae bacterium]